MAQRIYGLTAQGKAVALRVDDDGRIELAGDAISAEIEFPESMGVEVINEYPIPVSGPVSIGVDVSGGVTPFKSLDLDETPEEVKATPGQVYFIHAINRAATVRYLKFYNAAVGDVTVGTTVPVLTFPIPSPGTALGGGFVLVIPMGIAFSVGITVAATTGFANDDTGAPDANDVIVNIGAN